MPIKVLQVLSGLHIGGVQSVILNYYRNINRDKVQFDFVVMGNDIGCFEAEVEKLGGKIYHVRNVKMHCIGYVSDLMRILGKHEYNIIQVHMNFLNFITLLCAKAAGIKIRISHSHNNYTASSCLIKIVRIFLRKVICFCATDLWACSITAGEWLYGKKIVGNEKFKVCPNAIETSSFYFDKNIRTKIRNQLGIKKEFVLMHSGSFTLAKNHKFILEIFHDFLKMDSNAVLILLGDGENKQEIEMYSKQLGINDKIMFLGNVNNVNEYLMAGDVFLFPSKFEGLPMALIEAQISGLYSVVSEAIPQETDITNKMEWRLLKEGSDAWAKAVIKYEDKCADRNVKGKFNKIDRYTIEKQAVILTDEYLKFGCRI